MTTDIYTNRPGAKDFTLNYFYRYAAGVRAAQLACPFFTDATPVQILRQAGCSKVQLLVRLCEATNPDALIAARAFEGVDIRYYTSPVFHAKFYILGERALVGSANLTNSGMMSNFDELPGYFDELWSAPPAAVLTPDALTRFRDWHRATAKLKPPPLTGVPEAEPVYINVKSQIVSSARTYLESFRIAYYETLVPNHRLVRELYREHGGRHAGFEQLPEAYEIDRFLFWARGFTTDEDLEQHPIRTGDDLRGNIRRHIVDWFAKGDVNIDGARLARIAALQALFADETRLAAVSIDEIPDMLVGCAAFEEMLRFTKAGLIATSPRSSGIMRSRTSAAPFAIWLSAPGTLFRGCMTASTCRNTNSRIGVGTARWSCSGGLTTTMRRLLTAASSRRCATSALTWRFSEPAGRSQRRKRLPSQDQNPFCSGGRVGSIMSGAAAAMAWPPAL